MNEHQSDVAQHIENMTFTLGINGLEVTYEQQRGMWRFWIGEAVYGAYSDAEAVSFLEGVAACWGHQPSLPSTRP